MCACVSDDFPVRSLYIDSYYSEKPGPTTLIYVAKPKMCNLVCVEMYLYDSSTITSFCRRVVSDPESVSVREVIEMDIGSAPVVLKLPA